MSNTIVFLNAVILVNGYEIEGELYNVSLTYSAAMLDQTPFGQTTKINQAGLLSASLSGAAHADFTALSPTLMWQLLGDDASDSNTGNDTIVSIFPNNVTVGTPCGYAMKCVVSTFSLGGNVGGFADLKFAMESRGIESFFTSGN